MTKQVKLTLSDELFGKIEREKETFGYLTIQEVMNEILRNKFFRLRVPGKSKAGRPRKFDETKAITRHGKIFSSSGKAVEV